MPDVIVVGGGLLGSCVGYDLARAGADVLLVDRQDLGYATWAGAGILSPETSIWGDDHDHDFSLHAAAYYERLIANLEEDGGGDGGYGHCQVMVVAGARGDDEAFASHREILLRRGKTASGSPSIAEITAAEAKKRFPALGEISAALLTTSGARVNGAELRSGVQRAALGRGLTVVRDSVDELLIDGDRVTGVSVRGRQLNSDQVVLATGAWTAPLLPHLARGAAVAPMRGQISHLQYSQGPTSSWPAVVGLRGHYILPWPSGRVVAGATREAGSGIVTDLTVGGVAEVLREVTRLAPGLASAAILEWRVGLRPVSADGRPLLGALSGLGGCYLATGHGAGGLLLGPYSAQLVADAILGAGAADEMQRYSPDRFATSPSAQPEEVR